MRIQRVDLIQLELPLVGHFETSYGRQTERETVLVRLVSEGISGWGEAAVSEYPDYCYETPAVALLSLQKYFFPLVAGRDFVFPQELVSELSRVQGYPFSRTGVETAFLDLYCRTWFCAGLTLRRSGL